MATPGLSFPRQIAHNLSTLVPVEASIGFFGICGTGSFGGGGNGLLSLDLDLRISLSTMVKAKLQRIINFAADFLQINLFREGSHIMSNGSSDEGFINN